jgi:predicted  nucleic acid-binding Zn-ribbon protein
VDSPFYKELDPAVLKKRISQLEGEVQIAAKTIARLEARIAELEGAAG